MKQACKECGIEKDLDNFHKHKGYTLGVRRICKTCANKVSRDWYFKNRDHHIKTVKQWALQHPESIKRHKKAYEEKLKSLDEHSNKIMKKKISARKKVDYMIFSGKITKPTQCTVCGCHSDKIEAHHYDYEKPSSITWVCSTCHGWLHRRVCISEFEKNVKQA